jgi:multiple sugar transport system substrate-binding protein
MASRGVTRARVLRVGAGLLLIGAGAAAGALTACGQGAAGPGASPPAPGKGVKANLVWLIWSSNTNVRGEAYTNITTAFQREYPEVTVEQISGGGNLAATLEKLMTLVAADQPIDILGVRHDILGQYVEGGLIKDLGPLLKRDAAVKLADHLTPAVEMLSFKGRQYALPIGLSTSAMAYNADLFAKTGLAAPDPTWDWKQFQELAQRLTDRQGEAPVWGTHVLPSSSEIFYWTWMNGGEPFTPKEEPVKASFTQAETMEAVQWLTDLATRYAVKAPFDSPDGKGSNGKFAEGRVAMFPVQSNNTRELQSLSFKWDVVPFPRGKKGVVYPLSSFSYGLYSRTRNEDLAWRFWALVVGVEGQREWMTRTGEFLPSHKSLQAEYEKVPLLPANRKLFSQAAANGRPTPKATRWASIAPVIDEQLQAADGGKTSVRSAMETLDRDLVPLLAKG